MLGEELCCMRERKSLILWKICGSNKNSNRRGPVFKRACAVLCTFITRRSVICKAELNSTKVEVFQKCCLSIPEQRYKHIQCSISRTINIDR